MNTPGRCRTRGYTLMHMMVATPLLLVFLLLSSKLFISNNTLFKQTTAEHERLGRLSAALHQLREDAWVSREAQAQADGGLLLTRPAGQVRWSAGPEGGLVRTPVSRPEAAKRFEDLGARGLGTRDGGVVLTVGEASYLCPLGGVPDEHGRGGRP